MVELIKIMKTKKLFWSVLILIGIICIIGYVHEKTKVSLDFTYTIKATNQEYTEPTTYKLSQVGNSSIKFVYIIASYCEDGEKRTSLKYTRSGKNIEIRHIFKRDWWVLRMIYGMIYGPDGMNESACPFEVKGQIKNLEKGEYNIKFIYDDGHDLDNPRYSFFIREKVFELK